MSAIHLEVVMDSKPKAGEIFRKGDILGEARPTSEKHSVGLECSSKRGEVLLVSSWGFSNILGR